MTSFKLFIATTIMLTLVMRAALAQAVIDEPGMYAFYHPNSSLRLSLPAASAEPTPGLERAMLGRCQSVGKGYSPHPAR